MKLNCFVELEDGVILNLHDIHGIFVTDIHNANSSHAVRFIGNEPAVAINRREYEGLKKYMRAARIGFAGSVKPGGSAASGIKMLPG